MLFHDPEFLFVFLPVVYLVWRFLKDRNHLASLVWLFVASMVFYIRWQLTGGALFSASIVFNHLCGRWMAEQTQRTRKLTLWIGILVNVGALIYYKYSDFLLTIVNDLLGTRIPLPHPFLLLGISFFTFQQVGYLIDAYRGRAGRESFLEYGLFVTFFPQLIAGPIVHHREMLPQLQSQRRRNVSRDLAVGVMILSIGLFKKSVLADAFARYVSPAYEASERGAPLSVTEGWIGVLAFALQIYFDFSGYSDMALGLARMFGVLLPVNFDSPLKATSLSELWRRWHITLGRFLRDALFVPLGGQSRKVSRRCLALFATMVVCGIWHGSGWTYLVWGVSQGAILVVEHGWNHLRGRRRREAKQRWVVAAQCLSTTIVFAYTLILFRSQTLRGAFSLCGTLLGLTGQPLYSSQAMRGFHLHPIGGALLVLFGLNIVWGLPNTQQIMGRFSPACDYQFRFSPATFLGRIGARLQWRPRLSFALWNAALFVLALSTMNQVKEFIYFQF